MNVGHTSQCFYVRQKQHVTKKKFEKFVFNGNVKPKNEQPSMH